MAFDGIHALIRGDYVTSESGELGPWAGLVTRLGLEPRSTTMKVLFVVYDLVWLVISASCIRNHRRSPVAMIIAAAVSLWYLPFGTLLSLAQLVLLAWVRGCR